MISNETRYLLLEQATRYFSSIAYNEASIEDLEHRLNYYSTIDENSDSLKQIQEEFNNDIKHKIKALEDQRRRGVERNAILQKHIDEIGSIEFPEEYYNLILLIRRYLVNSLYNTSWEDRDIDRINKITFEEWLHARIEDIEVEIARFKREEELQLHLTFKQENFKSFLDTL